MCLITNKSVKIAKKDIVVYKIMNKDLSSQYQRFQYELGKTYFTDILPNGESLPYCSIDAEYLKKHYENVSQKIDNGTLVSMEVGFIVSKRSI